MAKFCTNCGQSLIEGANNCPNCGAPVNGGGNVNYNSENDNQNVPQNVNAKSKVAAGLLGIFLGSFGVHNFYLGYTGKAVAQLLLTLIGWILCGLGPLAAGIWRLIEGIMILAGSIKVDGKGQPLGE